LEVASHKIKKHMEVRSIQAVEKLSFYEHPRIANWPQLVLR